MCLEECKERNLGGFAKRERNGKLILLYLIQTGKKIKNISN